MTQADLQAALDTGGAVEMTAPLDVPLTAPLVLHGETWFQQHGHMIESGYEVSKGVRGPCFVTSQDATYTYRLTMECGRLVGGGIQFTRPGGLSWGRIADYWITGADIGIDDFNTAAWDFCLERIWVQEPRIGFRRYGGTTLTADNLFVTGAKERAYDFYACYTTALRNCAFDHCVVSEPGGMFRAVQCRGLVIDNLHFENNETSNGPLVALIECSGVHGRGWWTVDNRLRPKGHAAFIVEWGNSLGVLESCSLGGRIAADTGHDPRR